MGVASWPGIDLGILFIAIGRFVDRILTVISRSSVIIFSTMRSTPSRCLEYAVSPAVFPGQASNRHKIAPIVIGRIESKIYARSCLGGDGGPVFELLWN
jgi:hypothetical protein